MKESVATWKYILMFEAEIRRLQNSNPAFEFSRSKMKTNSFYMCSQICLIFELENSKIGFDKVIPFGTNRHQELLTTINIGHAAFCFFLSIF